jgi:flavin reductase (DIM6/NTAB) family NADH-FMN oxidoreductase RutF
MAEAMNKSGGEFPDHVSEFTETGLTPVKADIVAAPMVLESPVNFECRLVQILEFGEHPSISSLVIGEVVRAHVRDEFFADGQLQPDKMRAIGRLLEPYCRTNEIFEFNVEYTL